MQISFQTLVFCTVPLIAACGGGTETYPTSFTPIYADGSTTLIQAFSGQGVTGFSARPGHAVQEFRVRYDETSETLYVQMAGEPEKAFQGIVTMTANGLDLEANDGTYIELTLPSAGPGIFSTFNQSTSPDRGHFGLETPASAIPTGAVSYSGSWSASQDPTAFFGYLNASGSLDLDLNFDDGTITGNSVGDFTIVNHDESEYIGGDLVATVTGAVDGSRIAGNMSLTGVEGVTGDLDMIGALYGETGEFVAGGMIGSLTSPTTEYDLGGRFLVQENCGIC